MVNQRLQLAVQHMQAGRNEAAAATLLELVRREPKNLHALNLLASACLLCGKLDQALYYAHRSVELAPNVPTVHATLGNCLATRGQYSEAHAAYERAWSMGMRELGVAESMLYCLRQDAQWATGAKFGTLAMSVLPNAPMIAVVTSECLRQLGRSEEALTLIEPVARAFLQHYEAMLAYATLLNYVEGRGADLLGAHSALASVLPEHRVKIGLPTAQKAQSQPEELRAKGEGVLRIGFVSGDFRRHSCAWFILPLLREAKRIGGIEFVLYSNEPTQDDVTNECKSLAVGWREVWTWNDARLAEQVKLDKIDALVDLAGHTPGNRLRAFSMRAAPLQATWLGYPATTGVKEVDIRIVDWVTDPISNVPSMCVERVVRLGDEKTPNGHQPLFCFEPPKELPEVGGGGSSGGAGTASTLHTQSSLRSEARSENGVVLCCFNSLQKYSKSTLKAWAEILRRVPEATLIIKAQGTHVDEVRADLESQVRDAGLAMDRVRIIGYARTNTSHLAMYQACDIQLDTFPYNGATTTCESLVMGVPVVTRCGDTHASRVGASIVTAVYGEHANDFIAKSADEYVEKAVAMAGRVEEFRRSRTTLRQMVLGAKLCDASTFLAAFARAIKA